MAASVLFSTHASLSGRYSYEIDVADRAMTILECRAPWRPGGSTEWTRFPICRFRDTKVRKQWSLYWRDRRRSSTSSTSSPIRALDELIDFVAKDRSETFWGDVPVSTARAGSVPAGLVGRLWCLRLGWPVPARGR